MKQKVLVVDDEKNIVNVLSYALEKEGFEVEKAYDGYEAFYKLENFNPKLVILDLMIPGIDGYEICRKISNRDIGILMVTAKNDITDKLKGLELGADDYITKPFDIREVTARVKALVRRISKNSEEQVKYEEYIKIKDLYLNKSERIITINDEPLDFTAMEFDLLYFLLSNPNRVYSRDDLLSKVWGIEYIGGTRTVDTHVQRIRKKIGDYQNLIITVHGIGYKGVINLSEN